MSHKLVSLYIREGEYYTRTDTDNVITELKSEVAQLEDDVAFWKNKYNDCKRELDLLKDTNAFYKGK